MRGRASRDLLIALALADAALQRPPQRPPSRRDLLALSPLLLATPAVAGQDDGVLSAIGNALGLGDGGGAARVEVLSTPAICQGRCREQDFVVVKYVGRRADGTAFDNRYEQQPLIYELGGFYLPGVDSGLDGACVGTKLRYTWPNGVNLGFPYIEKLPAGEPISLELELVNIRYSLFGEKMRLRTGSFDYASNYWFAEEPLTLTSAADYERGHKTADDPVIKKDNPFSIGYGEKNLISNPSSTLGPLFKGMFGEGDGR